MSRLVLFYFRALNGRLCRPRADGGAVRAINDLQRLPRGTMLSTHSPNRADNGQRTVQLWISRW